MGQGDGGKSVHILNEVRDKLKENRELIDAKKPDTHQTSPKIFAEALDVKYNLLQELRGDMKNLANPEAIEAESADIESGEQEELPFPPPRGKPDLRVVEVDPVEPEGPKKDGPSGSGPG